MKGLKDVKIETPSSLQKKVIKKISEGNDLLIKASPEDNPETGYLVPVLDSIARQDRRQGTKAIVITSDRERAETLDKWIWAVGYHSGIESAPVIEGGNIDEQKTALSAGPTIIVATTEHLCNVLEENRMVFREVGYLVIDNADEISSWDDVDMISKRIIGKCQRIVSLKKINETLVEELDQILREPGTVGFEKPEKSAKRNGQAEEKTGKVVTKDLTQYYINVPPRRKISTLIAHLDQTPEDTVVIFTASKRTSDRLYRILRKSGRRAASIHSRLDEKTYNDRFGRFQNGNVQHLIVGEISAKNLNINNVMQVINYDVPESVDEYRHRAQLVADGKASRIVSLVSKQDRGDIHGIIKELGYAPEELPLPESVTEKDQKKKKDKRGSKKPQKTRGKKKRPKRKPAEPEKAPMGLPRPSYDKLSGGRTGEKKKKEKGIVGFFKKLFSSD